MKYRIPYWLLSLSLTAMVALVFAHEKTDWAVPEEAKKVRNPVPMTRESLRKGKEIYEKRGAACHGVNGDGKGPMAVRVNPKPTNFHEHHQMEMPDGEFFWKILTGRGAMPSYKKELTEEEIWQVINYISTFGGKN